MAQSDVTEAVRVPGMWIGTANRGYAQYAQEEIRRLLPGVKFVQLQPGEVFLIELPAESKDAIGILREQEPMFLRHVQPANIQFPIDRSANDLIRMAALVRNGLLPIRHGCNAAVQIRKAESALCDYSLQDMKKLLDETFATEFGAVPVVREADTIISVFVSSDRIYMGASSPESNLSDWAGGAIRFRREEEQVSRSKFKLLEAEQRFGLDFRGYRNALDIGAAPGGWSSLLLERGVHVTAIDPGSMHPSLLADKRLTYLRQNAADVKLDSSVFDLLVCDMSWDPKLMAKLVSGLVHALKSGATAVITVKLMHKKPFQTVRDVLRQFEPELELARAKQLFHNRDELTLLMLKK